MKIAKALLELGMTRSMGEGQRLIKQGAVLAGGCIPPCNMRKEPYKCVCGGWRKVTNPTEDINPGEVVRISKGNYRLLVRDGKDGFDLLPGIGRVQ